MFNVPRRELAVAAIVIAFLPSFRSRMMMIFMAATEQGNVICKLSMIAIMSPKTLISEKYEGMIDTATIVVKMTKAPKFARSFW